MGGLQTLVYAVPALGGAGRVDRWLPGAVKGWGGFAQHLPCQNSESSLPDLPCHAGAWGTPRGALVPLPRFMPPSGTQVPTKKPRNRSIFQSLFCCLCRDEGEPCAGTTSAPLLVEENGALPKVFPPCPGTPTPPT